MSRTVRSLLLFLLEEVDGHVVTVKGSKGELTREFNPSFQDDHQG